MSRDARVVQLDVEDCRWNEWIDRCPHDIHHRPTYAALEAKRLGGVARAYAFIDGHDVALMPLVVRDIPGHPGWHDAVSPYGYAGPIFSRPDAALAARALPPLVDRLRFDGLCTALVRTHTLLYQPLDIMRTLGVVVTHGPTAWIDLTRPEPEQWADYRSGHRNLIRRAQRAGFEATVDPPWDRFEDFYTVYSQTMDALAAQWSDFARDYLLGLKRALGSAVSLCLVDHSGQVAAGGVFTQCNGIVQYHFSGTHPRHRSASPSRLMLDHMRRWAIHHGHRALHLGGGVGGRDDALFRFKRGFSRDRAAFSTWRIIADPDRYHTLLTARNPTDADDDPAGFFPAYRKSPA